jgi:UV DNA damage endonuclease
LPRQQGDGADRLARVSPPVTDRQVTDRGTATRRPVRPGQHDDWIDGAAFVAFMRQMGEARFDVILEAKQKDLALLRLREAIAAADLGTRIW